MLLAVGCDLRTGWGLCFVGLVLVLGLLLRVCVGDSPCCFVCCSGCWFCRLVAVLPWYFCGLVVWWCCVKLVLGLLWVWFGFSCVCGGLYLVVVLWFVYVL